MCQMKYSTLFKKKEEDILHFIALLLHEMFFYFKFSIEIVVGLNTSTTVANHSKCKQCYEAMTTSSMCKHILKIICDQVVNMV